MHVVLFDIDGTLTQSQSTDGECFHQAVKAAYGIEEINTDWSSYIHTTDSGIHEEIFRRLHERLPTPHEIARFQNAFVMLITEASNRRPFQEVAGATVMLDSLTNEHGHVVALATGGWRASASIKLRDAGIHFDRFPSATSDDAISRTRIMEIALDRACASASGSSAQSIVYVGDGVWDARACRQLGIPFVGIAKSVQREVLMSEGAVAVLPDYTDLDSFRSAILDARRRTKSRSSHRLVDMN